MTKDTFRSDIQGLRALAVLLVLLYHADLPIRAGFLGVDVFFVISGYVIGKVILKDLEAPTGFSIGSFLSRRVRRILPAAAALMSVVVLISIFFESPNGPQQNSAKAAIGSSMMIANFVFPRLIGDYFSPNVERNPLLHMWSLSVEEQFYIGLALLLVVVMVGTRDAISRRRRFTTVSWLTLCGSFGLLLAWKFEVASVPAVLGGSAGQFFATPTRAWQFASGLILVASLRITKGLSGFPWSRPAGLILVLGAAFGFSETSSLPGLGTLLPVGGTLLLLASSQEPGGRVNRLLLRGLSSAPAQWIGDRSYSLYLWHWPAVAFVKWRMDDPAEWALVSATLVSVIPACISFRFLESPARKWQPSKTHSVLGVAAVCIAVPLAGGWLLGKGSSTGWGQDWTLGAHAVKQRDCDAGVFDPERCTWPVDDPTGRVVLIGDSQAWSYGDAVIEAAGFNKLTTTALVLNNCPFVGNSEAAAEFISGGCVERQGQILNYLEMVRPSYVVIANLTSGYVSTKDASKKWSDATSALLTALKGVGIQPIVVLPPPLGDGESGTATLVLRPSAPRFTERAETLADRSMAVAADMTAIDEVGGVRVVDPAEFMCDVDRCEVADSGGELYSDMNHLSVRAVRRLVPTFRILLSPL